MAKHTALQLSSDIVDYAEVISPRDDSPSGDESSTTPALFTTKRMKRLSTPWPVCLTRGEQLAEQKLGEGVILDPACGSGSQLFAYCRILNRPGIGIELDSDAAILSAANGRIISESSSGDWRQDTRILVGDGLAADAAVKRVGLPKPGIAVLHVDPARPSDAQRHSIDEMEPSIADLLDAWADHLVPTSRGPGIIIDLSPRLLPAQQEEVESLLRQRWPEAPVTWEWVSTGRGRIDRLTIWFGAAAAHQSTSARMLRLMPDGTVVSFAGSPTEAKEDSGQLPSVSQWLTIVDSALLASGLQGQWVREALPPEAERSWVRISGRRPMLLSSTSPDMSKSLVRAFVSASGEVTTRLKVDPTVENISPILVSANSAYLSRLTLRCTVNPSEQPEIQRLLDKGLKDHSRGKQGFLADIEIDGKRHWYVCRQQE